ncbi:MAG: hypothetical protein ABWY93_18590 [Mycobacterium sp.]
MAVTGPPQRENKVGRTANNGWTEIPDQPYTGPSLELPPLPGQMVWLPQVEAWWEQIRSMPHCVLWTATDWMFALETAYMKLDWWSEYFGGAVHANKATEIRRREDQIGTTLEARRKLLIRYVPVETMPIAGADDPVAVTDRDEPGKVTSISDRRKRLAG